METLNQSRPAVGAQALGIAEGSNQVQRFVVAEQLIKEFIEKYGMGRDWSEFL